MYIVIHSLSVDQPTILDSFTPVPQVITKGWRYRVEKSHKLAIFKSVQADVAEWTYLRLV